MLVKDGKLYTSTQIKDDLWEIDIAAGDRKSIHDDTNDLNSASSGTHVIWNPHRNLMWQSGFASVVMLYDPATVTSEPLWCPRTAATTRASTASRSRPSVTTA